MATKTSVPPRGSLAVRGGSYSSFEVKIEVLRPRCSRSVPLSPRGGHLYPAWSARYAPRWTMRRAEYALPSGGEHERGTDVEVVAMETRVPTGGEEQQAQGLYTVRTMSLNPVSRDHT